MFARTPDVAQVVVLTLVELAEHALQEHFRKADDGVQRGTQLVGHAGQEFRLVLARDFECGALPLQLPVQLRVDQGQCGLAGECPQQVADLLRDVPGCMAADNHGTDDAAFAKHGDGNQGTPAALGQDPQVGIAWRVAKVRELQGPAQRRCLAEEGVIESYPGAPESVERFRAGAEDGRDAELPGVLVELVDRAAVRPGQLYRLRDDRIEHLGEVQAEALRLTHCAEGLELIHLALEFVGTALQRPDEINGTNGESRLRREGREDLHGAIAERVTWVRDTESTPTTSPSSSIGTPMTVRKPAIRCASVQR